MSLLWSYSAIPEEDAVSSTATGLFHPVLAHEGLLVPKEPYPCFYVFLAPVSFFLSMFGSQILLNKSEKRRLKHENKGKKCVLLMIFQKRADRSPPSFLTKHAKLTLGELLPIRKSTTVLSLFTYPHYSHHHPKIARVAPYLKNNPDSAKILTSIERKTLAFI